MGDSVDDGKWKRVGKTKVKSKFQKQEMVKKMPKVQDLDYLKQQSIGFDNVVGQPLRDASNIENTMDSKQTTKSPNRPKRQRPKKTNAESQYQYKTIEEALKNEDSSLQERLTQLREKFSRNSNWVVWLKEMAVQLNTKLSCPEESPTFSGHQFDYPLCKASKNTYDLLMREYGEGLDEIIVPLMFQHCLNSMLDCIKRDKPSWGFRLCIQVMAHSRPDICSKELEKYLDEVQTSQNVPKRCLSLLWALGQTGFNSLSCGMQVWLQLMLPTLSMKNISQYSMSYIGNIIKRTNKETLQHLSEVLKAEQFLEVARWRFDSRAAPVAKSAGFIKEQIQEVYPTFRELIMNKNEDTQHLFECIMKISGDESVLFTTELANLAIECMASNPHCFKVWRDLYPSSFYMTSHILEHILENWSSIIKKLPKKPLRGTIRAFHNTNTDAAAKSDNLVSKPGFHGIRSMCENINDRLLEPTVHSTPFIRIITTSLLVGMFALAVGYVIFDVQQHDGVWVESHTYSFLKSKGVIAITEYVWRRSLHFAEVAWNWLQVNVPMYWGMLQDMLGPYFHELLAAMQSGFSWLMTATEPAWTWLADQTAVIFPKVVSASEDFALQFLQLLNLCIEYIWAAIVWIADFISSNYKYLYQRWSDYVAENPYSSDIMSFVRASYDFLIDLTKNAVHAVGNYIAPDKP